MNTYGQTACARCGKWHKMYRMLCDLEHLPGFNWVNCECGNRYRHSDKFDNVKTEFEKVKEEGRF